MSDIVTQLRKWADNAHEQGVSEVVDGLRSAAAEIERLREELTASHESHGNEVGALTERLSLAIHERDEARREVCELLYNRQGGWPKEHANERGWDCFKEDKEDTDD